MDSQLKTEFEAEFNSILKYWADNAVDDENGGFYGQINACNNVNKSAAKGSVLNARILWTFSAAYNHNQSPEYLALAWRSFHYMKAFFVDEKFGGLYWAVDAKGRPMDAKKQIYALAFGIYGMAEFYKATKHAEALQLAKELFYCIEEHSFDHDKGGYFEAFSREWSELADLRLSEKDANEKKTMNTHLHVLEGYANLYQVWPDQKLEKQIHGLLEVFDQHIINEESHHLKLFFNEKWHAKSEIISFGHDVEASWLMLEAAEVLGDEGIIDKFKLLALSMASSAARGLDESGALTYELEPNEWNKEKHWWVQAEAMVGFLNAFELSGDALQYDRFLNCWNFVKNHVIDRQYGEWFWGLNEDLSLMPLQDKVGLWKCPYHNVRACLEVIKRLK